MFDEMSDFENEISTYAFQIIRKAKNVTLMNREGRKIMSQI